MINKNIRTILETWKMEIRNIFLDQGVFLFVIIVPLFYPILYALCYNTETVRDVPVTVVDCAHTALSRQYIRALDATAEVHIVGEAQNQEEAIHSIRTQKAYAFIVIPSEFQSNLKSRKQTTVSVYTDMSGMLYYKSVLVATSNVTFAFNDQIRVQYLGQGTDRQDAILNRPVDYEEIILFNSAAGMGSFLLPAVLMLIIQQTLLLGLGMTVGTGREEKRYHHWFHHNQQFGNLIYPMLGILLCYFFVEVFNAAYLTLFIPHMFHLNQVLQAPTLIRFMVPYILACTCFAMTTSILVRNREITMLLFVFTSVPILFGSGISWPWPAIPSFWKGVAYIFPSTWGINGFVRINNEGATLQDVRMEYIMLWVQALFYFMTTYFVGRFIQHQATTKAQKGIS